VAGMAYVNGTIQPRATVPVPRRKPARAVARGIAVPGIYGTAPVQQPRPAPRRRPARAFIRFVPVATVNAAVLSRQLLIALASQAGVDDYGNTFPQGIYAGAGIIEGPEIIASGTGGLYLGYSPAPGTGNLISSTTAAAGTDAYGNVYLAGTTSYFFVSGFGYIALTIVNGVILWSTAPSEAGPWTVVNGIGFSSTGEMIFTTPTLLLGNSATQAIPVTDPSMNVQGAAPAAYSQSYAQAQTTRINALITDLIAAGIVTP